ncbi:hypothetical protein NIES4071_35230 [Calothrix sp. NIES-4071]|nr:hypothetical protein NIES4071_35230 [Calothrix sp. NIES-4071]BAZ57842.1 hypothetical protein NIES4105_35160 [Calothrix sp. NIES-4105]
MPRCPVCRTKYVVGKIDNCSLCGWNLQPYSLVVGLVPEVILKEQARLEWARGLWASTKFYREQIQQFQVKLKDTDQTIAHLRSELEQAKIARDQDLVNLKGRELDLAQLRLLLEQANKTHDHLLAALQQKEINQANLVSQSGQVSQELIDLRLELKKANSERLTLETTLRQREISLAQIQSQFNNINEIHEIIEPQPQVVNIPEDVLENTSFGSEQICEPIKFESPLSLPIKEQVLIQVVTVDAWGTQIDCYQNKVTCFQEKLGDFDLEIVALPGGVFWMGSNETEKERESHEHPQHSCTVKPFYMSRFPITQAQWRVIANLPNVHRSLNPDPSNFKGENQPIEQVSWHDAIEFCARLTKATGRNYRLPSEAEWEYACRAGTSTPFHFGETITSNLANYDGNYTYGLEASGRYHQRVVPVESYQISNAFGLFDMHGNVWEWCADPWHDNYSEAPCDGSVWDSGGIENHRILRGGAWYCLPSLCRSAQRHWDEANHSGSGISFRVVCS